MWPRLLLVVAASMAALWTYAAAVGRLQRRQVAWAWPRAAAFAWGVLLAAGTAVAPVPDRFSGRVVEHLVLGMAAPTLIVLGRPVTLALRSASPVATPVRRALRSRGGELASHPLLAAGLFSAGPWPLWLTPLYGLERRSELVHQLVHVHLVLAGALLALAVLGLEPTRWRAQHGLRMLAAALLLPVHTLLGMVLMSAGTPWLNDHLPPAVGLDDQRLGAGLVWVAGDALATVALLAIGAQWARRERPARASARPTAAAV